MKVIRCPECSVENTVSEALAQMYAGKTVTCKRCSARFQVVIVEMSSPVAEAVAEKATSTEINACQPTSAETPSTVTRQEEQASGQRAEEATRRKRRNRAELRRECTLNVIKGFRGLHRRLKDLDATPDCSEEEVRRWVIDALRMCLGYEDGDLKTEEKVQDRRVDIVVRTDKDGPPAIVIELKCPHKALNQRVVDQAGNYAAGLNAPYALVTNGACWRFFKRTSPERGPSSLTEVFNVALLDDDGVSQQDAENLYLLSKRSILSGDTERVAHEVAAMHDDRLSKAILDETVLGKLRKVVCDRYTEDTGIPVKIEPEDFRERVEAFFLPDDF